MACTNEQANPLRGFWNGISRLKAVVRSKYMYPNETVFPTREDWWCVSSPWCSWALHLIRQHLWLGTAVHCRFPTEMLWHLPVWRSLSLSLGYTGSMRWPASCFRHSPMLPELRGDLLPEGSISRCSMLKCTCPEDTRVEPRLQSTVKPQSHQSHDLLSLDGRRNCSSQARETFSLLP